LLSVVFASVPAGNAAAQSPDARVNRRSEERILKQAEPETSGDRYGAIVVSASERMFRNSPIVETQAAAEEAAMKAREAGGGTSCQVAVWFRNACGALAFGVDGGWGASWGVDRVEAERSSLDWCRRYTTQCHVVSVECTSGK
jgi:serine/threonine-protein kinase